MESHEGAGGEAAERLVEMLVAAEMETLTTPYVVVAQRADGQICSIEGPYLDVVAALRNADARTSGTHEPGLRFLVTSLWPPTELSQDHPAP